MLDHHVSRSAVGVMSCNLENCVEHKKLNNYSPCRLRILLLDLWSCPELGEGLKSPKGRLQKKKKKNS